MTTTAGATQTGRGRKTATSARRSTAGDSESRASGTKGQEASAEARKDEGDEQSEQRADAVNAAGGERRTAHLELPGMSAEFRAPQLRRPSVPSPRELLRVAGSASTFLPPPEQLLYYTGLGAAAVMGVIEWPVAIAVGAGVAVAQRSHRDDSDRGRRDDRTSRSSEGTDRAETS
jgi:hypothetical protein